MGEEPAEQVSCQICHQMKDLDEVWPAELIRDGIIETIRKKHPDWDDQGYICQADLNHFRGEYVEDVLEEEMGQISSLHEEVLESLKEHEILSKNINLEFEQELTVWERMSDKVASFGGSWRFIVGFGVVIAIWVVVNSIALIRQPFDPYPYILLNLVLSCLAAIQAPVIMMSQNRQDAKDRLRSQHDYQLNLKAELEIRHLNEKMDLLLSTQWRRLLEIQRIQMEVLEELVRKTRQKPAKND
ncbi:MAG: DUF1003 domain-containing protein [Desulfobaccales bacterium]